VIDKACTQLSPTGILVLCLVDANGGVVPHLIEVQLLVVALPYSARPKALAEPADGQVQHLKQDVESILPSSSLATSYMMLFISILSTLPSLTLMPRAMMCAPSRLPLRSTIRWNSA
jgi:hypothetical protein